MAYADDVSILHHIPPNHKDTIQEEASNIMNWALLNNLTINTEKTKLITFSRSLPAPSSHPVTVFINDQQIIQCDELKVLGLTFASNMSWSAHCANVMKKCWMSMSVLRSLRSKGFKPKQLEELFYSLVFCHMVYAWPA